ncbi:MAG: nucleoside recognition domain-containing protein, partial [Pseudomonadales bacterium]|nr:nucleoside recognition domain-containing protein [Pseudomonadales bacterium]
MSPVLRFALPSALGALLFLTPVPFAGGQQIGVGVIANGLRAGVGEAMPFLINGLFLASATLSCIATFFQPDWLVKQGVLHRVFITTAPWLTLRVLAGVLSTLVAWQLGPDWIIGADTGQVAYVELAGLIFCIMLVANFLLPLLTDFGFLDFVGTLLTRAFDRAFRLPGRAALDAVTSWVGDSSVGALLTIRQYEAGHYTAREAAAVVTNFSAVSLPFCVVIVQLAKLDDLFFTFYLTTIVCGVVCALVTPRLPPLSRIGNTRFAGFDGEAPAMEAAPAPTAAPVDEPEGVFARAWSRALAAAVRGPTPGQIVRHAGHTILDIYVAVLPAAMTIEFLALVIV